ncbi:MAG: AbrB/MazE/SpoVT family DNA-binding domain-containing protein [Desulfobulbaceae bacterium]|nr:AbrB/MazE/SpoVT family DNA-binding domain-containing protein [Desulfobulbaceae bacterium]
MPVIHTGSLDVGLEGEYDKYDFSYFVIINLKNMHFRHHHGISYGATTIGARGQVVIPAQARSDLNLKEGDRMLVLCWQGKVLGLMKNEAVDELIDKLTNKMSKGIEELKKWKTSSR